MKQAPQEPTVTLREACDRLALDYAKVRLLFTAAKRTPQGWVVLAASVTPKVEPRSYDRTSDEGWDGIK